MGGFLESRGELFNNSFPMSESLVPKSKHLPKLATKRVHQMNRRKVTGQELGRTRALSNFAVNGFDDHSSPLPELLSTSASPPSSVVSHRIDHRGNGLVIFLLAVCGSWFASALDFAAAWPTWATFDYLIERRILFASTSPKHLQCKHPPLVLWYLSHIFAAILLLVGPRPACNWDMSFEGLFFVQVFLGPANSTVGICRNSKLESRCTSTTLRQISSRCVHKRWLSCKRFAKAHTCSPSISELLVLTSPR